ncbi:bifunctional metallophosphatase/5'-nucleotidase [Enterovibrio norvegicus]|uniref:bifunctional metallophosphatase/5'-nucleotidase n=1 Tax=Enterovibrio norvegicus TaxID=188144 RepID=UPI0002E86277|nr:bifunctional UDP-sugar hydrolase/5'-nucleotidase [Enterovibrio norvegicus]OEE65181.1 bifunctional metallophosphatase/5'-nucleotidase [Enterovibrio norvegicus]
MPKVTRFTLSIAHINDTHSHFEPTPVSLSVKGQEKRVYATSGGFARIKTVATQFRENAEREGNAFLFLHAGDCFQGTLYYNLFKGDANAKLLNMLDLDAMALGNHELDLGNTAVSKFLDHISFPLLAGNWDVSQEIQNKPCPLKGKPLLYDFDTQEQCAKVLVKTFGDHQVAIFGVSIDKMAQIAMPDADTPFLESKMVVLNTIAYIRDTLGINNIVLLSHLGYDQDLKMAEEVEGLSVVVGGHSHVLQGDFSNIGLGNAEPYGRKINNTLVVQAGCHALAIGKLDVTLNSDGSVLSHTGDNYLMLGRGLALDASWDVALDEHDFDAAKLYLAEQSNVLHCRGNKDVKALLNTEYRPAVLAMRSDVVTMLSDSLRHIRVPDEKGPSQIAPLVCEGLLYSANIRGHGVDFAIHNAGGVRVSLEAGKLTAADVAGRLLPFAIDLMVYEPTGAQVKAALEGAINNATNNGVEGAGNGSFPYTAGLRYTYECNMPEGQRITQLQYQLVSGEWRDIELEKTYRAVSSAYTSQGKEGYDALKNLVTQPVSIGVILSDSFIEYARANDNLRAPKDTLQHYVPCAELK